MIFITLKTSHKTCSKIQKAWFLLLQSVAQSRKMNSKMFLLIYWVITNHQLQQFPHIRHDQCLVLLYYFHQKIMQKKSEIFKKCNFLGQALDFLPPRKPGLYIHLWIFSSLNTCLNLSKPWYLWPNLETLVETIPRYSIPVVNSFFNKSFQ